jgi:hypothetical protein
MRIQAASAVLLIAAILAAAIVADAAAAKKSNTGGGKKDKEVIPKDKGKFTGDKNDPVIGIDLGTTYGMMHASHSQIL